MKVTPKQYAISLFESLDGKSKKETEEVIEKFTQVLIANNQASQLEKIVSHFSNLWARKKGLVETEIISARKLEGSVVKSLKDYIKKLSQAQEIKIEEKVDKSIIGGVIIKYGDKIMDSSLRNRLREFKSNLKK